MMVGLALMVAAVGLVATHDNTRANPEAIAPTAGAITIAGADSIAVHRSGYDPHTSSSWHRHSGLHAVIVLTGTLTVYGPDCRPVQYGPGESYVGGQDVHLVRNETDESVEMTETLVFPTGVPLQGFVIPSNPPAGCQIP